MRGRAVRRVRTAGKTKRSRAGGRDAGERVRAPLSRCASHHHHHLPPPLHSRSACAACFRRQAAHRQASLKLPADPLALEPTFISPTQAARARVEAADAKQRR